MSNIIVTGANEGIGYYMVEQLLKDGHFVAVLDVDISNIKKQQVKYGQKLLPYICDVRETDSIETCVGDIARIFNGIDIAVHNACRCTFTPACNTEEDIYHDVFNVNYFGALRLAKAVVPYMQKPGKVIFTSSGVGVMGFVNISPYASSKGAIESLAKCLGIEYHKDGITFHIFHPPLTRTKSAGPLPIPIEFKADPKIVGSGLAKHIGSKRFVICHSLGQKLQTMICYLFPVRMGRLMSKMTDGYAAKQEEAGSK